MSMGGGRRVGSGMPRGEEDVLRGVRAARTTAIAGDGRSVGAVLVFPSQVGEGWYCGRMQLGKRVNLSNGRAVGRSMLCPS